MEFPRPRRHEPIEKILKRAKAGDAFFVLRAVRNGDLAGMPETEVRRILATVADNSANFAQEQLIPLTEIQAEINRLFIDKRIDFSWRILTGEGQGAGINSQIDDFYNRD